MEEKKEMQAAEARQEETKEVEDKAARAKELAEKLKAEAAERKARAEAAAAAVAEGKGILTLETPIIVGEDEVTKLAYDFTKITGLEYADALDSSPNSLNVYSITTRQALALFATAAAKATPELDMKDIVENIGATDALEGVQLATLFFNASTRAGRMRISKK